MLPHEASQKKCAQLDGHYHQQALAHQGRIAELEQLIGRQAYEMEVLKKASRLLTGPPNANGRSS